MFTTPEIICDLFSFLDKDQIERIQLVNQFWNNVIIQHKNILPLRQFVHLDLLYNQILLYATEKVLDRSLYNYKINFDGTNLSKIEENVSSRYSQLTVDEVLTNLNSVVYGSIQISVHNSEDRLNSLLNVIKLVTTETGGRFRGQFGICYGVRFGSKLDEIFDNYIIVDSLTLRCPDSYIREVCTNPEIVQLPSTPKEIRLAFVEFKENEGILNFTCNGKLNGANRLTIGFKTSDTNYENFIWQWFELYRTHQNPISLVGNFELKTNILNDDSALDAVKTFLNNTQLRVKYSFGIKEFHSSYFNCIKQHLNRRCVLHETGSYALVIEMAYEDITDISINASDLDQLPHKKMRAISFCVKSL